MNILAEDNLQTIGGPSMHSQLNGSDKNLSKHIKSRPLRLDSPTTVQACQELGLLVEDLKQRPIEDFREPKLDENIVQVRYEHYLKRFNQAVKDVMSRKRRLARMLRNQQLEQQQQQEQSAEALRSRTAGTTDRYHTAGSMSMSKSPTGMSLLSPTGITVPSPMATSFNKTISYFRHSHKTPKVLDLEEIIGDEERGDPEEDSPLEKLERTLEQEVERFNRTKKQKQKEAKYVYEEEISKIMMMEKIQEREKRKAERERKLSKERLKTEIERKKMQEEKIERIKEAERSFKIQKQTQKEKIQQKLEAARKKFDRDMEEKRRKLAEQEAILEEKRRQVLERKEKFEHDELRMTQELKHKINLRLQKADEAHQELLKEKQDKMKSQIDKVEGSFEQRVNYKRQLSSESSHNFIMRLVKKEESIQGFKKKYYHDIKKKESESVEKSKRFQMNQQELQEQAEKKNKTWTDKFAKIQETIEVKRENDNKTRRLKQELNRLKLADKLENHMRLDRRIQFEKLKVLDKERREQERVFWSRSQKEIAQKAKLEVSVQAKIERDRIEEAIGQLTRKVYEANTSKTVTDGQKKILRAILQPEDYEIIQGKEIKKNETLGEGEQQEGGMEQSRVQSPLKKRLL